MTMHYNIKQISLLFLREKQISFLFLINSETKYCSRAGISDVIEFTIHSSTLVCYQVSQHAAWNNSTLHFFTLDV